MLEYDDIFINSSFVNCFFFFFFPIIKKTTTSKAYPEEFVMIGRNDCRTVGDGHLREFIREVAGVQFVRDEGNERRPDLFLLQGFPGEGRRRVHEEGMLLEFPGVARSAAQPLSRILDEQAGDEVTDRGAQMTRNRRFRLQYPPRDIVLEITLAINRERRRAGH